MLTWLLQDMTGVVCDSRDLERTVRRLSMIRNRPKESDRETGLIAS